MGAAKLRATFAPHQTTFAKLYLASLTSRVSVSLSHLVALSLSESHSLSLRCSSRSLNLAPCTHYSLNSGSKNHNFSLILMELSVLTNLSCQATRRGTSLRSAHVIGLSRRRHPRNLLTNDVASHDKKSLPTWRQCVTCCDAISRVDQSETVDRRAIRGNCVDLRWSECDVTFCCDVDWLHDVSAVVFHKSQ